MERHHVNQGARSKNNEWYLLGEYSLSKLLPDPEKDDQGTVKLPSIPMPDMDIPLEHMKPIEMALRSFAREALARLQPEGEAYPGQIRISCQKKIIDEKMKGGWGYFVIEKPKDASPHNGSEPQDVIDFYIYEEGP